MDEGGVRQALVIPGHGYLRPNGIADTRRVNDEIAAYRDRTPDRFPVACGIVEPRDGAAAFAEIDRVAGELDLVALSFHTRFQGVSVDSRWVLRYLERMGEHSLVPIIHAMDDTPEEALWKLAAIAREAPRPHDPRARRVRRLRGHAAVLLRRRGRAQRRLRHQPQLQLRLHRGLRPALRRRAGRVRHRPLLAPGRTAHQSSAAADRGLRAHRRREGGDPGRYRARAAAGAVSGVAARRR